MFTIRYIPNVRSSTLTCSSACKRFLFTILFTISIFGFPSKETSDTLILRERHSGIMGTDLHISVIGTNSEMLEQAIDNAIAEMQRVEDMMTDWRPSPLTSLNESAGKGFQEVPHELVVIIAHGVEMGTTTNGAFDITYAGVGKLWSFKKNMTQLPDSKLIKKALSFISYQDVDINLESSAISIPPGFRIGLGGIAKGYAIDRAMSVLINQGIKDGIVNAGGDMKILGSKFGNPWEIALKHPRDKNRVMASLKLSNVALVTSGDYERFFKINGKQYHHIINPRTGYPSTGCLSATVIAPETEFADALATALCVMTANEGLKLIESLDSVEAIVVGMEGNVKASTGLKNKINSP